MSIFSVVSELRVGRVIEVSGTAIRVELDGSITELTRTYSGYVYPIGQFASVIKIHFGRVILLAYVRLLRMRSDVEREEGRDIRSQNDDSRIIEADLFAEAVWDGEQESLKVERGIRHYPLPGQAVYLTTQDESKHIYRGAEASRDQDNPSVMIEVGSYIASGGTACFANLDKLLGLHCAVLGSTGAGKSATVAALIHSMLDHRPHANGVMRPLIIIIDPHGEYNEAFGERSVVYRAFDVGASDKGDTGTPLKLPYWMMTAEEFRETVIGKTEWEATSENNIVYKAVTHARMVARTWIEPSRAWSGRATTQLDPADPRCRDQQFESSIASYNCDTPDPFSLDEFENHIRLEQGVRIKSGSWEALSPSDSKAHASVLDKLKFLRCDPRLEFMMKEYSVDDADLAEVLMQFVGEVDGHSNACVRVIDISGLPNEVAGPLTAAIARLLFQYKVWQTRDERERNPVLLVCEEAHRYVPDTGLAEYQSAQKSIRRVAKEGRKYGFGLMLVSQRPADVERTVLSQCNSWFVMRLTNTTDQEYVSRFLPDSLAGLSKLLPSLSRQEALFVGEAAAVPARIIVRTLTKEQLPQSNDISFVRGWMQEPVDKAVISAVVSRWRRESSVSG
jgi:hypothetical protein